MYPRLMLPCGDFTGCECKRGRLMNFLSLFKQGHSPVCGTYNSEREKVFRETARPRFPGAGHKKESNKKNSGDTAPQLCLCVRNHILGRLNEELVSLDEIPDTISAMIAKLGNALQVAEWNGAAVAGSQRARAATALTAAARPTATVAMVPRQQQRHDIADVIETCVAAPTEQSVAMASIALYRHKRAHGDDPGMSILQDALEGAKRMCREKGTL